MMVGVLSAVVAVGPVAAQSMYKCTVNGKIEYSGKPCQNDAAQKVIRPDAGPNLSDQIRAQEEVETLRAREQVREFQRAQARRDQDAAVREAERRESAAKPDPDNEKVMVHGPSGWDKKTRGQIAAEEAARERGRARAQGLEAPEPPGTGTTGKAWEKEKVLTHSIKGWDHKTRAEIVKDEGAKEERRERASIESASAGPSVITSCDSGGCWDTAGRRYNGSGGTLSRTDGKVCTRSGNVLLCN
jgi:hypothetical protein